MPSSVRPMFEQVLLLCMKLKGVFYSTVAIQRSNVDAIRRRR